MATNTVVACLSRGTRNRVPSSATGRPRCSKCHTDLPWLVDAGDDDYDHLLSHGPRMTTDPSTTIRL
jgi:thioredoxin 2